jgi:hypothetical protein
MGHHKADRLWKVEDSSAKVEVYISGYAFEHKVDLLRCDVLVTARHFSGSYTEIFPWANVIRFAEDCAALADEIEPGKEHQAVYAPEVASRLEIRVGSAGTRKVCWQVVCRPVTSQIEVLSLSLTTESQLLNGIRTQTDRAWVRWPGPAELLRAKNS